MSLSHEHVGPKILGKIKIYVLTRAELLFPLCYEIPCSFVNFSCKLYNHKQIANVDLVLLFVYAQVTTTHNLKIFLAFCLILNFELSSAIVSILIRSDFDLVGQEVYE